MILLLAFDLLGMWLGYLLVSSASQGSYGTAVMLLVVMLLLADYFGALVKALKRKDKD